MRAVERKPARGSLRWLREAVNAGSGELDGKICQACSFPPKAKIEWRSPLEEDEYAEYGDHDFLTRLDLTLEHRSLETFWPRRGPQWDALARTSTGQVILVEAKANIPEIVSRGTSAGAKSKTLIENSLAETKRCLRVREDIPWSGRLYQYANRLAHLYLLRELNGVDAHLIFLYFTGAADVNGPETVKEWTAAITVAKGVLGLGGRHPLHRYVHDVFVDVAKHNNTVNGTNDPP